MEKLLAKMYEQSESKAEKKQYRVLNALKAAAFLNLAVFYFLYNINVAQGTNPAWDYAWWQRLTLWSIVVLCGMTFSQGSNYLKWGLGLLGVGTAISLCTYIFTPQHPHLFRHLYLPWSCISGSTAHSLVAAEVSRFLRLAVICNSL